MNTSDKLDKFAPAMAKAQAEMGGAVKDSTNPFFNAKYADLASVWKACKDALHGNDFSVVQAPIDRDGRLGVSTMLLHSSGQFIEEEFTLGVKKQNDPQADGSSLTYARRYALAAFVGVCPVDDDGEASMMRGSSNSQETITPKQAAKINEFLEDERCSKEDLLKWAGVGSVEEIPAAKFGMAIAGLSRRVIGDK